VKSAGTGFRPIPIFETCIRDENMIIMLKQHWVILLKTKATHFTNPPQSLETQASVDHAITAAACETNHSQLRTPRLVLPNMSVGSLSIHALQHESGLVVTSSVSRSFRPAAVSVWHGSSLTELPRARAGC
jgi:hypothetical protein